jgi:hypothetical protein
MLCSAAGAEGLQLSVYNISLLAEPATGKPPGHCKGLDMNHDLGKAAPVAIVTG